MLVKKVTTHKVVWIERNKKGANMSGNYYIYLRKSRKDLEAEQRGDGATLARHRKTLLALAKQQGLEVRGIFEEVVSGDSIAARPEMQRLLARVEEGGCDGVLVMEIERLARGDTIDQGIVARTFQLTGTRIITPAKTYDPENEFDEEYFEFGLFMSRREYKTIARRINRGRIASVKEGKYISSVPPFGYERKKLDTEKGYTLVPLEPQASTVRLIFSLYVNGLDGEEYGAYKIAAYLDSIGAAPLRGGSWSPASIRDILKNEVYAGKIAWGKRKEIKSVKNGVISVARPTADDYICVDGLHEALVDLETFKKAQSIMRSHTKPRTKSDVALMNPLAGLVYCKKCGALMTRLGPNSKNRYATLKCPNRNCSNISAPIYLIEEKLILFLREWLAGYQVKLELEGAPLQDKELQAIKNQIEKLKEDSAGCSEQLNRAYDFLEKGLYSEEIFLKRSQLLTETQAEYEQKIAQLLKKKENYTALLNRYNDFVPQSIAIMESYNPDSPATERNQLLKRVVSRVEYEKNEPNRRGRRDNSNFTLDIHPLFH